MPFLQVCLYDFDFFTLNKKKKKLFFFFRKKIKRKTRINLGNVCTLNGC